MDTRRDLDVIVVGAGLAGLRCAQVLAERRSRRRGARGRRRRWAGGSAPTGSTGSCVDRGFQLLNPAYPAVRRWVDVDALGLQPFGAGVAARTERRPAVLGHPLREPGLLPQTLRAVVGRPREVAALARWAAPLLRPAAEDLARPGARGRAPTWTGVTALDARGPRRAAATRGRPLLRRRAARGRRQHGRPLRPAADVDVRPRACRRCPATGWPALPAQLAAPLGDRVRLGRAGARPVRHERRHRRRHVVGAPRRRRHGCGAGGRADRGGRRRRPRAS